MVFRTRKPGFAFLAHPRNKVELLQDATTKFLMKKCRSNAEFVRKCDAMAPVCTGEFSVGDSQCRGELICIARLPRRMFGRGAHEAVVAAARTAISRGARVLGLGALTSPVMRGGKRLIEHLPDDVSVTNGNAYTVAVVRANVEEAQRINGLVNGATVAVVGCTGSVGAALSRMLVEDGLSTILIGRNADRVRETLPDVAGLATVGCDLTSARAADIVVLATSDSLARLRPQHVSPGAFVIDIAQPKNIPSTDFESFRNQGVVVAEGGRAIIPNFSCSFCFSDCMPGETFACLAETYMFARSGLREHSIGTPKAATVRRITKIADTLGVGPSPLQIFKTASQAGQERLEPKIEAAATL